MSTHHTVLIRYDQESGYQGTHHLQYYFEVGWEVLEPMKHVADLYCATLYWPHASKPVFPDIPICPVCEQPKHLLAAGCCVTCYCHDH